MTNTPTSKTKAERILGPAQRRLKRDMARELVMRMRRKWLSQQRGDKTALTPSSAASALDQRNAASGPERGRRRKRKAALALSASVMGFTTAAADTGPSGPAPVISALAPGVDFRANANELRVSEAMKEALAEEEGVRLTVYRDVAGYPTVGVGHLVRPEDGLRVGDRITYDQAIDFLEQDLVTAEEGVKRLVGGLPLYQHEFDALADLIYNVGEGNVSESESPNLNRAIQLADYDGIAEELHYYHAAGAKARGLIYRSERREAIFMNAAYDDPREAAVEEATTRT